MRSIKNIKRILEELDEVYEHCYREKNELTIKASLTELESKIIDCVPEFLDLNWVQLNQNKPKYITISRNEFINYILSNTKIKNYQIPGIFASLNKKLYIDSMNRIVDDIYVNSKSLRILIHKELNRIEILEGNLKNG